MKNYNFRTLPSDEEIYAVVQEHLGLDKTAIHRLAIREFAYKHGYDHPDFTAALINLKFLVMGCRLANVEGMDKYLSRAERLLRKHAGRLKWDEYPEEIEREVVEQEAEGRKRMTANRLASSRSSSNAS